MSETPEHPETPEAPPPAETPDAQTSRIGVDSWVAESEARRSRTPAALLSRGAARTPDPLKLLVFVAFAVSLPFWTSSGDLFIFGTLTLISAALALGLNVVVGFAGLLDLGYVAYAGVGAYTYASLSSPRWHLHWPALATIPIAMAAAGLVGLLLGISSRRLLGDYYAIVTLFFAQAFASFTNVTNPGDITGGPNGLPNVDPITFFGHKLASYNQQYYLILAIVVILAGATYLANMSRTGRAWRAQRDDPLAAQAMSIPVNRVKILAAVMGAAIAGLCGTIFAATYTAAVSTDYSVPFLILIYATVILGGIGSIAGVLLGAAIINCTLQFLAPQNDHPEVKRWLFYGTIILLVAMLKPVWRSLLVLVATIGFGFAVHALAVAYASHKWTSGVPSSGGSWIAHWAIIPNTDSFTGLNHGNFNNIVYIGLVVMVVITASLKGWWRMLALVPTLYLTVLAWENLLAASGGITAYLLFGVMLIALMAKRPQGLFGEARVEIV
ncbi:MAG TPA: branched-chain amino acid ABC transporter permease [Gaiellaceae bacterium]|jgi:branched-chain amino acid transport system permease protein